MMFRGFLVFEEVDELFGFGAYIFELFSKTIHEVDHPCFVNLVASGNRPALGGLCRSLRGGFLLDVLEHGIHLRHKLF